MTTIDADDLRHLERSVELARTAVAAGHKPYGTLIVDRDGRELFADHNRDTDRDSTRHPELAVARWAAATMDPDERARATVYTSAEHCPMCAGAHAWAG